MEQRTATVSRYCHVCREVRDHEATQVLRRDDWQTDRATCSSCSQVVDVAAERKMCRRKAGHSRRGSWQGGWTGR